MNYKNKKTHFTQKPKTKLSHPVTNSTETQKWDTVAKRYDNQPKNLSISRNIPINQQEKNYECFISNSEHPRAQMVPDPLQNPNSGYQYSEYYVQKLKKRYEDNLLEKEEKIVCLRDELRKRDEEVSPNINQVEELQTELTFQREKSKNIQKTTYDILNDFEDIKAAVLDTLEEMVIKYEAKNQTVHEIKSDYKNLAADCKFYK